MANSLRRSLSFATLPNPANDTHVWLWTVQGAPGRLSKMALRRMEAAHGAGGVIVSVISVWEIALLEAHGRIALGQAVADWVREALRRSYARLLPLEPEIAIDSTRLPGDPHGDPADRILMASARITRAPLVTCDVRILNYASGGHVPVLDARP